MWFENFFECFIIVWVHFNFLFRVSHRHENERELSPGIHGYIALYLCSHGISYRPVHIVRSVNSGRVELSQFIIIIHNANSSVFKIQIRGFCYWVWLWKYIILLIYKTNFDSLYWMLLYTRHLVMTKPSGLTQRYCLHLQLQARLLSFPVSLHKAHFPTHTHAHTHAHTAWNLLPCCDDTISIILLSGKRS
jgi:hypothetical protein